MRNRLRAVSALFFSIVMSVACWREIGRAFPGPSDGLIVNAGIPAFAAFAVYLFVAIKCVWERLWFGPVAAYLVISVGKAFEPHLVSPFIGAARIASLALWMWTAVIGTVFVWFSFADDGTKPNRKSRPAALGKRDWKSIFAKRTLLIGTAYLAAALLLDWRDLHHRRVLRPMNILLADAPFEAFLCAWAAVLTEVAVRSLIRRRDDPRAGSP